MTRSPSLDRVLRSGRQPLRLVLVSPTYTKVSGADRDWIVALNGLGRETVRVSWVGFVGCADVARYVNEEILDAVHEVDATPLPVWHIARGAYAGQPWLLVKTILAHAVAWCSAVPRLRKQLSANGPVDVVVTNSTSLPVGPLIAFLLRAPHVWSVKEPFAPTRGRLTRAYLRCVVASGESVFAASGSIARQFGEGAEVVHDGVDVAMVCDQDRRRPRAEVLADLDLDPARPLVLQSGWLGSNKGQSVTARAFAALAREKGEPPFSLLFAGREDASHGELVRRELDASGVDWESAVRFREYEANDFSFFHAADIVIQPSVFPDAFPNVVREALAAGKPTIGSNIGGIPEMIRDGVTGLLVEPGDAEALAGALERLLSSPTLREELASAGHLFARSYLDIRERRSEIGHRLSRVASAGRLSLGQRLSRARGVRFEI